MPYNRLFINSQVPGIATKKLTAPANQAGPADSKSGVRIFVASPEVPDGDRSTSDGDADGDSPP